jgi:hypothetical protein
VLHGIFVAVFEGFNEDGGAPSAGLECAIGDFGAGVADVEKRRPCVFDTGIIA